MTEDTGNFASTPEGDTGEPVVKPTGIQYVMYGDDSIARINHDKDGERLMLGKLENGILIYESEQTKAYHAKVAQYLKDSGVAVEGVYVKGAGGNVEGVGGTDTIPPPPLKNKRDGDKTEAYVEWLKQYKPEEFNAKYGVTGQGFVTKTRKVPDPEIPGRFTAESYRVPALLARRKTHLTERPDQVEEDGFAPIPPKPEKGFSR